MAAAGIEALGIEALWQQLRRDWLIQTWPSPDDSGADCSSPDCSSPDCSTTSADWFALVAQRRAELAQYRAVHFADDATIPVVLVAEADPARFLAGFWAGLLSGWSVVLANAQWGKQEWSSLSDLVRPDVIWPSSAASLFESPNQQVKPVQRPSIPESILIPTGGSSGRVKLTHHTWTTLTTSALGFLQYFTAGSQSVSAFCVLPVYHVSGLMQALRVWLSGGQLILSPFKRLLSSDISTRWPTVPANTFISLVPTQLARLFDADCADWLTQFQAVLLGGAPAWSQLITQARSHKIPLCLSYGMTETAAMVTALHPQDFLNGNDSSGRLLPHAAITIEAIQTHKNAQADTALPVRVLPVGEIGRVVIRSDAITQDYFNYSSSVFANQCLYTDDLGYFTATGHLHVTGRVSSKIISGGENIYPAEVEAALRATGQVLDVCVVGLPDAHWGEAVTAVYVPANARVSAQSIKMALTADKSINHQNAHTLPQLSRHKCPKRWHAVSCLPRNAQGKINRSTLMGLLRTQLKDP